MVIIHANKSKMLNPGLWYNSRDLQIIFHCVQLAKSSRPPQYQDVMTCARGNRNRFRSFQILPPGLPHIRTMDNRRKFSDGSVEHAFVTINKWIPIKVWMTRDSNKLLCSFDFWSKYNDNILEFFAFQETGTSPSPSFVVIDNPSYPYLGK